jgi:hypothetical protein
MDNQNPKNGNGRIMQAIKIVMTLLLLALVCGVTLFPYWWLAALHAGPSAILQVAFNRFFVMNLLILGGSIGIAFAFIYLSSIKEVWAHVLTIELKRMFGYRFISTILPFLFALAAFRIFTTHLESSRFQVQNEILGKIDQLREASLTSVQVSSALTKGPLDYIFQDLKKIDELFKQIEPPEKLEERSVEQKLVGKDEGSLGMEKLAKFNSGNEHTVQSTENYRATELSTAGKLQIIYKSLADQGALRELRGIEIQNKDLSEFDSSVELLKQKYKLPIPEDQIKDIRLELLSKAVDIKNDNSVPMEGFVLVAGDFAVTVSTNSVQLKFQLVSSIPDRSVVFASVPSSGFTDTELERLGRETNWQLKVFGKIIHRNEFTNSIVWLIQPYAIFR